MTESEYLEKRWEIDERHKKDIDNLELEYCLSKTPYSVGDIVEDSGGAVLLTKIIGVWRAIYDRDHTNITLVFNGIELRKSDFTPKKNGGERDVYESNIKKILKKNNE